MHAKKINRASANRVHPLCVALVSPPASTMTLDTSQGISMLRKTSLVAAAVAALLPFASQASSHREAPNIARYPTMDSTDFYLFNSYEPGRDGYVTLLANYIPLQQPYGGPNYFAMDPAGVYEIHID